VLIFSAFWVASVEYQADVEMSERVMTQLSDAIAKFAILPLRSRNLGDFDPSKIQSRTIASKKWIAGCSSALLTS